MTGVPPWDSEHWNSPRGLDDSDDDRRVAWELRASLTTPEWALTDPRLDATDKLVCAALESLSCGAEFVKTDVDALSEKLRLMPNEVASRLVAPLDKMQRLGMVVPLTSGGFLLRRYLGVPAEPESAEHSNEGVQRWHATLSEEEKKTVMETLAKVIERPTSK